MTTASSGAQGSLVLDAEALYRELLRGVRSLREPHTRLAGIASGGAWLAQRLQQDLGLEGAPGVLSSAMHRDDFAQRGLASSAHTALPFDVNGADILVLDDVAYTPGPIWSAVAPVHAVSAVMASLMSAVVIVALASRPAQRVWHLASWVSMALLALYLFNAVVQYLHGH